MLVLALALQFVEAFANVCVGFIGLMVLNGGPSPSIPWSGFAFSGAAQVCLAHSADHTAGFPLPSIFTRSACMPLLPSCPLALLPSCPLALLRAVNTPALAW